MQFQNLLFFLVFIILRVAKLGVGVKINPFSDLKTVFCKRFLVNLTIFSTVSHFLDHFWINSGKNDPSNIFEKNLFEKNLKYVKYIFNKCVIYKKVRDVPGVLLELF